MGSKTQEASVAKHQIFEFVEVFRKDHSVKKRDNGWPVWGGDGAIPGPDWNSNSVGFLIVSVQLR